MSPRRVGLCSVRPRWVIHRSSIIRRNAMNAVADRTRPPPVAADLLAFVTWDLAHRRTAPPGDGPLAPFASSLRARRVHPKRYSAILSNVATKSPASSAMSCRSANRLKYFSNSGVSWLTARRRAFST